VPAFNILLRSTLAVLLYSGGVIALNLVPNVKELIQDAREMLPF